MFWHVRAVLLLAGLIFALPLGVPAPPASVGAKKVGSGGGTTSTDRGSQLLPHGAVARLGTTHLWHEGMGITSVTVSPNGSVVASGGSFTKELKPGGGWGGSFDRRICLWETATGRKVREFRTPAGVVNGISFSPDGRLLAAVFGKVLCLWDVPTGKQLWRSPEQDRLLRAVAFFADGKRVATVQDPDRVALWDLAENKAARAVRSGGGFSVHPIPGSGRVSVRPAALSLDGSMVAWRVTQRGGLGGQRGDGVGETHSIRVCDSITGKQLVAIQDPGGTIKHIALSRGRALVATGGAELSIRDGRTGVKLRQMRGFAAPVTGLVFSADSKLLASGHADSTVRLWDTATGRELFGVNASSAGNYRESQFPLAFSEDGKRLVLGWDADLILLEIPTGKESPALPGHRGPVRHLHFTADGRLISSCGSVLCSWETKNWTQSSRIERFRMAEERRGCLAVSPDGRVFIREGEGGFVYVLASDTGKLMRKLGCPPQGLRHVLFSPDGKALLVTEASPAQGAILYDLATGTQLASVALADAGPPVISPGGRALAWAESDGTVRLARLTGSKEGLPFDPKQGAGDRLTTSSTINPRPALLAFSSDGLRLTSAPDGGYVGDPEDTAVHIWRTPGGSLMRRFVLPGKVEGTDRIACLAFSKDGRTLATGHYGGTGIRLWEVASGHERGRFQGGSSVLCLAFSPDGALLASGHEDHTVLIWTLKRAAGNIR